MKIKTSDLIGPALDWAVAQCEDRIFSYAPSSRWAQGGPIIERKGITLTHQTTRWGAQTDDDLFTYGPTPLVAAMRCYVTSILGEEIEIPEELQ